MPDQEPETNVAGQPAPTELVFDGVTKRFDGDPAVSDVSFHVTAGEHVAIVGPSGAGKTTLLRLAGGAIRPDSGTVSLDSEPIRGHHTTHVYQGHTLIDRRTALANVLTGSVGSLSWLRGFLEPLAPTDPEPALALLDAVGLRHKADARVDSLSAGERQRVALARALMHDAPVVLADEPTANLDPNSRSNVIDVLDEAVGDRVLVTVLHEVGLALDRFDRIIGLADGRIHFDAPAAAVTDGQLDDLFAAGASTPDSSTNHPHRSRDSPDSRPRVRWYA